MKVNDSWEIRGTTILRLDGAIPLTDWREMIIDGARFEPRPVMDSGRDVIAVEGKHDLVGKEVEFR